MSVIDGLESSRATWRTSTYSNNGGNCVQVATSRPAVLVRDSKNPDGPKLAFAEDSWRAFAHRIRAADLALTGSSLIRSRARGPLHI
jgi:hypothetical protein